MSADPTSGTTTSRVHSPWMVIFAIVLIAVILVGVLTFVTSSLAPPASVVPTGLSQATLDDGSVLVVHQFSEAVELELLQPPRNWRERIGLESCQSIRIHAGISPSDRMSIWLARYDATTGQPLPFDRWSYCIARTADGTRVVDQSTATRATRTLEPHPSTSTMSGSRPFSPLEPGKHSHIFYVATFPSIHSADGKVAVDVMEADEGLVATLELPLRNVLPIQSSFEARPLPQSAVDGEITVELKDVTAEWTTPRWMQDSAGEFVRPVCQVKLECDVQWGGKPTMLWDDRQIELLDPLGNVSPLYDCNLSPSADAWKVRMSLFRSDLAPFERGETLMIEDVLLPGSTTKPRETDQKLSFDAATVELLGVGGPGEATYRYQTSQTSSGSHSAGFAVVNYTPPWATLRMDGPSCHAALRVAGLTRDHRLSVLLTDDSGRHIQPKQSQYVGDVYVLLFEPDEWLTAVNVYVNLQPARVVEFTVKPPPVPGGP